MRKKLRQFHFLIALLYFFKPGDFWDLADLDELMVTFLDLPSVAASIKLWKVIPPLKRSLLFSKYSLILFSSIFTSLAVLRSCSYMYSMFFSNKRLRSSSLDNLSFSGLPSSAYTHSSSNNSYSTEPLNFENRAPGSGGYPY